MVFCAVQLKSKCPFPEHFWLKPEDSGWTSRIQITTSKKNSTGTEFGSKAPDTHFYTFSAEIFWERIFPDPLVKLQQNRATEGHSFKVFNTFLITMGIIKPLYHTMDFKSTFIYLNTSEISLSTFSIPLNTVYTISDAVYVEDCCEPTLVNSEWSLLTENSMRSMNGNLLSAFCFYFSFDSIRAE